MAHDKNLRRFLSGYSRVTRIIKTTLGFSFRKTHLTKKNCKAVFFDKNSKEFLSRYGNRGEKPLNDGQAEKAKGVSI